ncbi:zinc finger protein 407 [Triplophysa dalaica]|uniref:zinc finger protein 407 n=1 Tax=Triplophysa dalaica TaxID=1582913 RepID=UPI0024DF5937|nr:zinc finger protein 407 [Triplophysa dalaica]
MDNLKRKLRSGKEISQDKNQATSNIKIENVPYSPKRNKASKDLEEDEESEQVLTSISEDQRSILTRSNEHNSSEITELLVCSHCSFLAKTQTALKIHSKRKHSHGIDLNMECVPEESPDTMTAPEKSFVQKKGLQVKQLSEPQMESASMSLSEEVNTDKRSDGSVVLTDSKHTQSFAVGTSKDERTSPTKMLLQIVDPISRRGDAQAGCSFHIENKLKSKECDEINGRNENHSVVYACSYCGHEFRDEPSLETHIKSIHTKEISYLCNVCSYSCVANSDYEKHCLSNKHKKKMLEQQESSKAEEAMPPESVRSPSPTHTPTLSAGSASQHQCEMCTFTADSTVMLAQHIKMNHPVEHRFHCRACHYYTNTTESMEIHLSEEAHQELAKEQNISPLFKDCVEKIIVIFSDDQEEDAEIVQKQCVEVNISVEPSEKVRKDSCKQKRGRPKTSNVTVCSHCGLVASNATNLSVHIRRKHSRMYSFVCKLCNYYCVTKGDMDRHCETKKHINKTQAAEGKGIGVVPLDNEQLGQAKENETELVDKVAEIGTTINDMNANHSGVPSNKSKHHVANSCSQCDFVAHSALSLALHVRRKHTKDFEFVCVACAYYTVTRREMFRHAATEKHKQKRQSYLERKKSASDLTSGSIEHTCDEEETRAGSDPNSDSSDPTAVDTTTTKPLKVDDETFETAFEITSNEVKESTTESAMSDTVQPMTAEKYAALGGVGEECMLDEDKMTDSGDFGASKEKQIDKNIPIDVCIFTLKALAEHVQGSPEGDQTKEASQQQDARKPKTLVGSETKTIMPNPQIRCEDCGFLADGLSGLNVHISMKHPSKEKHFHCLLCGKSFYTESNLQQHLSSATHMRNEQGSVEDLPEGGASFKCVRCNEPCQTEQDLFVHIKEKHEEMLKEVNKYVLEDTEQINRERQENQGNVCKYCGKVCKSSNSMAFLAHVRTHTGSKPFMCKICNFATAQLGDARNHVKRHLGMREYKCHICGWAFVMKKHLNTHLLGKHGLGQPKERKFECEMCERSFSEKWALNNHMKLHMGNKPFKCSWPSCHYAFLTLSAMKDHLRTHTGEKSFLCDLCGFAGGTRHALTKHRRQHTGERPFKCQLCNFASTTQSHLTRHKRVHTGEKPYRCPWCNYRSNCAENIRKHILHTGKHEGVMMYNCPLCSYGTNAPMDFRNHLKETHPDIENPDLAYLHAGIVSKSFECRLKGQGASFVQTEAAFAPDETKLGSETVQQVIIIQGYDGGEVAINQALEESAAATLQTLAMSGQMAEVLHITEDGQLISSGQEMSSVEAQLREGQIQIPGTTTQYVLVESSGETVGKIRQAGECAPTSMSESALDALLCAVTELGQQDSAGDGDITTTTVSEQIPDEIEGHLSQAERQSEGHVYEEVTDSVGVMAEVLGSTHEPASKEMQEVLQFAASQIMMREGLTQVVVNDEGTHYIVTQLDGSTLQVEGTIEDPSGEETIVYSKMSPE